jgi:hypothetical protein
VTEASGVRWITVGSGLIGAEISAPISHGGRGLVVILRWHRSLGLWALRGLRRLPRTTTTNREQERAAPISVLTPKDLFGARVKVLFVGQTDAMTLWNVA